MKSDLKTKLQNLSEKFTTDSDVVALKAHCSIPESEESLLEINEILNRLVEKYPEEEEILGLFSKKEKVSLEELIKFLEKKYPGNAEVITIKALSAIPEGKDKEDAVTQCLKRLLEANEYDRIIMEYLGIKEKKYEEKLKNMIFVKGGVYPNRPNIKVLDLFVGKYTVAQNEWKKMMGKNPSHFEGARCPVETVSWIDALEYCNKISEKCGLQPVYKIENGNLTRIIYRNGEEVYPDQADFKKTEGYRLPTELEWEWFARGGNVALQDGTFEYKYPGSDNVFEVAWCGANSENRTHTVGTKKPNQLDLYDCSGNVWEWVYDTSTGDYISEDKPYLYDRTCKYKRIKGGCWGDLFSNCVVSKHGTRSFINGNYYTGFRIVRTA